MNLNQELKQIEIDIVNDAYLFGEPIIYQRLKGVALPVDLQAVIQTIEDRNPHVINNPDLSVSDSMQFLSVNLIDGVPITGDKITFEGDIWYVMSYLRANNEIYDILCTRNRHHTGSHSKRII